MANKGEWSEVYTLLKLLSEGKLFAADSDLQRLENIYYPIIKVINPSDNNKEYHIDSVIKIVDARTQATIAEVQLKLLAESAVIALKKIKESNGSFAIPELEDIFNQLQLTTFKSDSSNKADISMVVHDINTGITPLVSFSIKSRLGSSSTLFNASRATNFTYNVVGELTEQEVKEFNEVEGKSKMRDKFAWLSSHNIKLEFETVDNAIFNNNLSLIDSILSKIISESLLFYYSGKVESVLTSIINQLEVENPINLPSGLNFYGYKVKRFLTAVALGMLPTKSWNGQYEASGGYIVVREDGEVLCYHIYNLNEFEDYLLKNTRLETPSTSRHDFGNIYKDDTGKSKIKLNLQIRFI
jgi:type II restriction enzyme